MNTTLNICFRIIPYVISTKTKWWSNGPIYYHGSSGSLGFQKRLLARNGGLSISYECSFTCIFSRPQYTLYILYDIENNSTVAEGSPMVWTGAVEDGDVKPNKTCRKNEK